MEAITNKAQSAEQWAAMDRYKRRKTSATLRRMQMALDANGGVITSLRRPVSFINSEIAYEWPSHHILHLLSPRAPP